MGKCEPKYNYSHKQRGCGIMSHSLKQRLEEFSKSKQPKKHITYTIGVNNEIKERFNMIRKNHNLTANELLSILLESYT